MKGYLLPDVICRRCGAYFKISSSSREKWPEGGFVYKHPNEGKQSRKFEVPFNQCPDIEKRFKVPEIELEEL